MDTVGIRALKAQLSRYLRRVQQGGTLTVTERGRAIATISPVAQTHETAWAMELAARGHVRWSGGKPGGAPRSRRPAAGASVADAVLEDRE
jgi:prevent-host-death family protein